MAQIVVDFGKQIFFILIDDQIFSHGKIVRQFRLRVRQQKAAAGEHIPDAEREPFFDGADGDVEVYFGGMENARHFRKRFGRPHGAGIRHLRRVAVCIERKVKPRRHGGQKPHPFHIGKLHAEILVRDNITPVINEHIFPAVKVRVGACNLVNDRLRQRFIEQIVAVYAELGFQEAVDVAPRMLGERIGHTQQIVIPALFGIQRSHKRRVRRVFFLFFLGHGEDFPAPAFAVGGKRQMKDVFRIVRREIFILRPVKQKDAVAVIKKRPRKKFRHRRIHDPAHIRHMKVLARIRNGREKVYAEHKRERMRNNPVCHTRRARLRRHMLILHLRRFLMHRDAQMLHRRQNVRLAYVVIPIK